MTQQRTFTATDNNQIQQACELIRGVMFVDANALALAHGAPEPAAVQSAGPGSEIKQLIAKRDWNTLFANQKWQDVLANAVKLNQLRSKFINAPLLVLQEYFPQELGAAGMQA